jgi:hypothetical protein
MGRIAGMVVEMAAIVVNISPDRRNETMRRTFCSYFSRRDCIRSIFTFSYRIFTAGYIFVLGRSPLTRTSRATCSQTLPSNHPGKHHSIRTHHVRPFPASATQVHRRVPLHCHPSPPSTGRCSPLHAPESQARDCGGTTFDAETHDDADSVRWDKYTLAIAQDDNWTEFCPEVVGERVFEPDDAYYAVRQVLLWAGLGFVEDGEKYGGRVGVAVDFGGGEKLGENGECGGEVEGSSGWAEAVLKARRRGME